MNGIPRPLTFTRGGAWVPNLVQRVQTSLEGKDLRHSGQRGILGVVKGKLLPYDGSGVKFFIFGVLC